ncbi:MAG: DoxX family protein [Xanthobacteraceae bacterium]
MLYQSTPLVSPALGVIYETLAPWTEALLRAVVGLSLVPHALRSAFGMFANTGTRSHNLKEFSAELDNGGYRPGWFWARAIVLTQLVCGPLLALGLFTRPAALVIFIFLFVSNFERWRVGRYFWNQMGLEFTLMWTVAALYFLIHGGGVISLDHFWLKREF